MFKIKNTAPFVHSASSQFQAMNTVHNNEGLLI